MHTWSRGDQEESSLLGTKPDWRELEGSKWRQGGWALPDSDTGIGVLTQGLPCALGAENVHLWQMCSQMRLPECAEAVSRASALGWQQFLQVDKAGAQQDQSGLGRKGTRSQLPGRVY